MDNAMQWKSEPFEIIRWLENGGAVVAWLSYPEIDVYYCLVDEFGIILK